MKIKGGVLKGFSLLLVVAMITMPVSAYYEGENITSSDTELIIESLNEMIEESETCIDNEEIVIESSEFELDEEFDEYIEDAELVVKADSDIESFADGDVLEMTLYLEGTSADNQLMSRATWQIPLAMITMYVSGSNYRYTIIPMWTLTAFSGETKVYNRAGLSMGIVKHTSLLGSRKYYQGGKFSLSGTIYTIVGAASFTKILVG